VLLVQWRAVSQRLDFEALSKIHATGGTLLGGLFAPPAAWAPPPVKIGFHVGVKPKITPSSPGDAHAAGAEPQKSVSLALINPG